MFKHILKISFTSLIIASSMVTFANAQENTYPRVINNGNVPKFELSPNISAILSARVIFDAYDFSADFNEVTGSVSRDESQSGYKARRAIWSLDGKIGKSWKFKTEQVFLGGAAQWDDAYFEFAKPKYSIYIGNNHQTLPMEGQNSSANTIFTNRALATAAFSQSSRNMGIAYRRFGKNWQIIGGIYGDNINESARTYFAGQRFLQTRATYAPIMTKTQILHLGASFRVRDRDDEKLYSYSSRPIQFAQGTQFLQTGSIANKDKNFGIETFYANGAFSIDLEAQKTIAKTQYGDLNFYGGLFDAVYYITGETRSYNATRGLTSWVKPLKPLSKGGLGAFSIQARYDFLDLKDGQLGQLTATNNAWRNRGGKENGYSFGFNWHPEERIIIRTSYSKTNYKETRGQLVDAASNQIIINPLGNGETEFFNLRAQFGF